MTDEEAAAMKAAEGGATNEWIKTKVDERGAELVDQFTAEAEELVKANPTGSHPLEATDCSIYQEYFDRYVEGAELYKAKARK
jgi:hypothetical protein